MRPAFQAALLAGAVGIYLAWEIVHRSTFLYDTTVYPVSDVDDWRYTAVSRLVDHGYALFSQVFSAQPPLLFVSLAGGMRLLGDSIASARWVEICFGLVALGSVFWIGRMLAGPAAGAVASIVLAVSPGFLLYSHSIEAEGPMAAMTALSLALAMAYNNVKTDRVAEAGRHSGRPLRGPNPEGCPPQGLSAEGRPVWGLPSARAPALAALAGLALAAAVLLKLFAIEAIAPALWLILYPDYASRRRLRDAGLLIGFFAVPIALELALISPGDQWNQVVTLHERVASVSLPNLTPPLQVLGRFFALDIGLTVLAGCGLVALLLRYRWTELIFLALWTLGSVVMLVVFRPLFPHHPAILLPGLAVGAGVGVALGLEALCAKRFAMMIGIGLALVVYAAGLPRLIHADRHLLYSGDRPSVIQLARFVDAHSSSQDMIVADDLEVADRSQRLVAPPLCDVSNVRLYAGYLTASEVIAATRNYRARLVVPSFGILPQVPGYLAWVRAHFPVAHNVANATVYERR